MDSRKFYFSDCITGDRGGQLHVLRVLVDESADDIDLFKRQLHGVLILRRTWHERWPKLQQDAQLD